MTRDEKETLMAQLVGNEDVTVHPLPDHSVTGKLTNHRPGIYQVMADLDNYWVLSINEINRVDVQAKEIYLFHT